MTKRVLISLVLGYVTCELIGAIRFLPYSEVRDAVTDALSYPGGLFSAPFFPQGIHSSTAAEYWPIVAFFGNLLFYAALWFGVLTFLTRRRETKKHA